MLFLFLLLVACMTCIKSEVIRPLADMDFKMVSVQRVRLDNISYDVTIKFTGPPDSEISLDEERFVNSSIKSVCKNKEEFTVLVNYQSGGINFHILVKSLSKDVEMKVYTYLKYFPENFQDQYPMNKFKYKISRKEVDGLTRFTAKIQRPKHNWHKEVAGGLFAFDLFSKDGSPLYLFGSNKYGSTTNRYMKGNIEECTCIFNSSAFDEDGVKLENFSFNIDDVSRHLGNTIYSHLLTADI